jgi:RNA polymerase sigma-70 factor (ECF subfamily)
MEGDDVIADDLALIRRCRSGDVEAFGDLVLRHQDRLFGTLVHMLGSFEDARDAAQDAFVLAFQKLDSFRGDSAFYSWLFRIAYNAAVTGRRKGRRERQHASVEAGRDQTGSEPLDERPTADPSYSVQSEERQALVRRGLDELPEEYRTVLVLKEMEGLRYEEIAEMVGCPIGTVRSRIHRAREELRTKLERALKEEG